MLFEKGTLLAEGKTKEIWETQNDPNMVIVENKKFITAFDDPQFTKEFETKAIYATATTCQIFELLKACGIPVAYTKQISPTEFVAPKCRMIPLEVVARRYAMGSYLGRNPQLRVREDDPPHRFHRLVVEFFLKTTKGELTDQTGQLLVKELDPKKGEEDPFILWPDLASWHLYHPKKPLWEKEADLKKEVWAPHVIGDIPIQDFENLLRETFLALEGAWSQLGFRLIDMKIEFGVTEKGELLVADVIDNDSWRLRDNSWQELSKQAFRDGEDLSEVERKYGIVANLVQNFRVPGQALVFWRGSEKDEFPKIPGNFDLSGSAVDQITLSGHKSPQGSLNRLEEILAKYPDGGAIIVKVGMSNGLGPILAARTSWPVISVPASAKDFPNDVWSSLRLPSNVPMATILSETNAVNFALNILAQKNPALYMQRQLEIEKLDT
jgi:phosphoribosylaminoimidazole carboxylase / phosphoribosylaminoimidazole-succinocarboxamide synthase